MKHIKILAAALLWLSLISASFGSSLNEGITEVRPGILAYTDMWHLCFYNDGLHAGQMSSHAETGRNIDLMHFHGRYKGGNVLADIDGPGVVYRVWSADPSGKLLFYPDGALEPETACDFKEYLKGKCGSLKAFAVGRYTNYTPVVFNDSLIITAKGFKIWGAYYQVSYMTFDGGHGLDPEAEYSGAQEKAKTFWSSYGAEPGRDPGGTVKNICRKLNITAGQSREVSMPGAGLVTEIRMRDASDPLDAMEDVWINIHWDGEKQPAISSPADAFFGNRFDARRKSEISIERGKSEYRTLALSATEEGYSCRWPMPFDKGMRLTLENLGEESKDVDLEIDYRALSSLPENTMRFNAFYKEQDYRDGLLSRENIHGLLYKVDQSTNYVALDTEGKGYYVGVLLYVDAAEPDWWGEGDEMIWVDGGDEALIRGTGTEDEFNWSYGFKENRSPISGALLAERIHTESSNRRPPHNSLYRYRLGDFVPFRESIKVTFERLGSTTRFMKRYPGAMANVSHMRGDDYASVAFWYGLPEDGK